MHLQSENKRLAQFCRKLEGQGSPSTPIVYADVVHGLSEQQFWTSVPKSNNAIRIIIPFPFGEVTCQTKIGEFEFAFAVDQDVGSLHVSVQDCFSMEIGESAQHLLAKGFEIGH